MKLPFNYMLFGFVLTTCSIQGFGLPSNETLPKPIPRIVGGRNAREGEIPYQLRLRLSRTGLCGGSLINVGNKQAVVTAAHCITSALANNPSQIEITGGSVSISGGTPNTQRRKASKVVTRGYNTRTFENDIAILALDKPFQLNKHVNVIQLPHLRQGTTGVVVASGWGRIRSNSQISRMLQTVDIPLVSNDRCGKAYGTGRIRPSMMCAGVLGRGGKDTCQGDSGGPLRAKTGNYLAGVTSFGRGCADGRYPGVYTRVSHYVDWIERTVRSF